MVAQNLDLYFDQNATWAQSLGVPVGYNGLVPTGTIRSAYSNSYASAWTLGFPGPYGGVIVATFVFAAVAGNALAIAMTQAQTAAIPVPLQARRDQRTVLIGPYDILCPNAGGGVDRLFQGNVYMNRGAT